MNNAVWVLIILLLVVSLCGLASLAGRALETRQTEAEAELTLAQTEFAEAETSKESQRTLSDMISELLAELRAERARSDRIQREQWQLLMNLVKERSRPRYTWVWVSLIIIGGIVIILLLRRRERVVILIPPPGAINPLLSAGLADIVPWQEQGAIQVMEISQDGQEIAIE